MTGGPRGTPLDLKAIEQKCQEWQSAYPGAVGLDWFLGDVVALLAHARALRVVLEEWMSYHNSINVPHGCSCKMCQRARAVLAAAQDGPA